MPLIPVRGYTCDVIPKNKSDKMPVFKSGVKFNIGGTAFMLNPITE